MLKKIYSWLHAKISVPQERGEYSSGLWQDVIRREVLSKCSDMGKARVVEIGCGEGLFLTKLAASNRGAQLWGVDNDGDRLKAAEAKTNQLGFGNVKFLLEDATKLSLKDGYFDKVVCINVLFNLPSVDHVIKALGEMNRICKTSGRIIFDFRNGSNPLLWLKYSLARFYDETVRFLPLKTYTLRQIESILSEGH